ncbi:DUF1240 domain-containing protein [Photorhabdus tasmaniensis]|uniref:DUF1240 domain-containing protein n=1 Tax=Photorhabdus tasmaniensis TaxID=1004159 RepID=UPI004042C9AE
MINKEKKTHITLWNRIFCVVMSVFFLFITTLFLYFSWMDFLSLINMNEIIYFSWRVFFACFGLPIIYYMFILAINNCLVNKPSPFDGLFLNLCVLVFILSFVASFPVSIYVDHKLKNSGYFKCSRTSLIAPNKYVKNMDICN